MQKTATVVGGAAALLLLIAVGRLPYAYYEFLRWAITVASVWLTVIATQNDKNAWALALIPTAILFNPIVPVYLTKAIWTPLNLLAAVVLLIAGTQVGKKAKASASPR